MLASEYQNSGDQNYLSNLSEELEEIERVSNLALEGGTYQTGTSMFDIQPLKSVELQAVVLSILKVHDNLSKDMDKIWLHHLDRSSKNEKPPLLDLARIKSLYHGYSELDRAISEVVAAKQFRYNIFITGSILIILSALFYLFLLLRKNVFQPLKSTLAYAENIVEGNLNTTLNLKPRSDLKPIGESLDKISEHIRKATEFAVHIGEGKLDHQDSQVSGNDLLGRSLLEMRGKLKEVAEEERRRNWSINGIATFSEVLRQNQHSEIEDLSYQFLFQLIKYLDANQGGVFLINEEGDDKFIELKACYAYERRKQVNLQFDLEEGLIGQCIKEKDTIYLEEIPVDYIEITSGLGEATPRCLLITPIKVNDEIYGAVELAFFQNLPVYRRKFIETVCETLGSTLSSSKMTLKTQRLLEESRQANQELQQKEEQMRQNAEELEATQEELNRKLTEIEEETNLSKNIVDAINKTNATIEFDLSGNILNVNDMYLSVMGFTRDELIGKNEVDMAPQDELDSQRYKMLWDSLKNGSFMSGEYRRISKGGREVWLNGTYNPIFNLEGKPYKVIQFAQFTTEEKEKDLDLNSKINAISNSFPIIEIDLEGKIKSANQEFVKLLGYKRTEIRNQEFIQYIEEFKDQQDRKKFLEKFKEEEVNENLVFNYIEKNGNVRNCLTIFTPIKNLSGQIYKILIILIDISDEKKLEKELINNQGQLSETIHELEKVQNDLEARIDMLNKAACIFELNLDYSIIMANQNLLKKISCLGMEKTRIQELLGHEFNQENLQRLVETVSDGDIFRSTFYYHCLEKPLFYGDTTIAPVTDKNGKLIKYIGIIFDVSDQISKENKLKESLAKEKIKNAFLQNGNLDNNLNLEDQLERLRNSA